MIFDEQAPCPLMDPSHLPEGRLTCPLPLISSLLLENANLETSKSIQFGLKLLDRTYIPRAVPALAVIYCFHTVGRAGHWALKANWVD